MSAGDSHEDVSATLLSSSVLEDALFSRETHLIHEVPSDFIPGFEWEFDWLEIFETRMRERLEDREDEAFAEIQWNTFMPMEDTERQQISESELSRSDEIWALEFKNRHEVSRRELSVTERHAGFQMRKREINARFSILKRELLASERQERVPITDEEDALFAQMLSKQAAAFNRVDLAVEEKRNRYRVMTQEKPFRLRLNLSFVSTVDESGARSSIQREEFLSYQHLQRYALDILQQHHQRSLLVHDWRQHCHLLSFQMSKDHMYVQLATLITKETVARTAIAGKAAVEFAGFVRLVIRDKKFIRLFIDEEAKREAIVSNSARKMAKIGLQIVQLSQQASFQVLELACLAKSDVLQLSTVLMKEQCFRDAIEVSQERNRNALGRSAKDFINRRLQRICEEQWMAARAKNPELSNQKSMHALLLSVRSGPAAQLTSSSSLTPIDDDHDRTIADLAVRSNNHQFSDRFHKSARLVLPRAKQNELRVLSMNGDHINADYRVDDQSKANVSSVDKPTAKSPARALPPLEHRPTAVTSGESNNVLLVDHGAGLRSRAANSLLSIYDRSSDGQRGRLKSQIRLPRVIHKKK